MRMIIRRLSGLSSTKVKHSSATVEITSNSSTMIHWTQISNPNTGWVLGPVSVPFIIEPHEYILIYPTHFKSFMIYCPPFGT